MSGSYIYILGSHTGTLYIGVTSNLYLRVIRTINPEFKDLAQTWGWKMITVHERMCP
jgi:predicted GIY-YIG superfamily endonuclease